MMGKTHTAVGIAVALAALPPKDIRDCVVTIGVAAVGSVICDIDADKSKARRDVDVVLTAAVIAAAILIIAECVLHVGIMDKLQSSKELFVSAVSLVGFLLICFIGRTMPHRSFMHSILAVILLGGCVYGFYPPIMPAFVIAMLSHMILDSLNYKKVQLFYPVKDGVSLGLCKADGSLNHMLFIIGWLCVIGEVLYLFARMIG